MSGGFFRGTSADQDTRFSNKQAKLLKSQKFPAELDHLVDMTKVKMDVIRPWIATRATELLGFEDEVLINFVYGLLDVKVVDGKKIQIQLTGFMEKNTGKFMKELWTLLLSAQNNVSGVPQQFLDAKEEEQRKKKEESDKIAQEIQKRKEKSGRELEREKQARQEDEDVDPKPYKTGTDILSRPKDSNNQPEEARKEDANHSHKSRNESSPSGVTSSSKSGPSYESHPKEVHKSRSPSVYSQSPRLSVSPRKRNYSPVRRSFTPVREYRSPHRRQTSRSPTRRSPCPRRRSNSHSRDRYPSPYWRRSHTWRRSYLHRRSPSPLRLRSRSPVHRRSPPFRRRSPSPERRKLHSPARRRSPILPQRKSPTPFRRSPVVRRGSSSSAGYESISPVRRSPHSSSKYRKQSPTQSPVRRHTYSHNSLSQRNRSPSPPRSQSPLNRSLHKVHNDIIDRGKFGRSYDERIARRLPVHQMLVKGPDSYVRLDNSPSHSKLHTRKMASSRKLSRSGSSSKSPVLQREGSISNYGSSETSREEERIPRGRDVAHHKNDISRKQSTYLHSGRGTSHANNHSVDIGSPDRSIVAQYPTSRQPVKSEIQRNDMGDNQKEKAQHSLQSSEDIEYGPGGARAGKNMIDDKLVSGDKSHGGSESIGHASRVDDTYISNSNLQSISKGTEYEASRHEKGHVNKSKRKSNEVHMHFNYSDSDDPQILAKKQHNRSDSCKRDISESSENDSQMNDKKAKRKRKEDKRLRKEEKRRRHEERRRRRSERRAAKQKLKNMDALSVPSEFDKHLSEADESDCDAYQKNYHKNNANEAESEQKRLEIELRKKALESLRAKKAINY